MQTEQSVTIFISDLLVFFQYDCQKSVKNKYEFFKFSFLFIQALDYIQERTWSLPSSAFDQREQMLGWRSVVNFTQFSKVWPALNLAQKAEPPL